MWLLFSRRSENENEFEQPSPKIKKGGLPKLKEKRDKELDLRIKEDKKLQEIKQATLIEKAKQREKDVQDQIASLEEQNKVCKF